MRAVVACGGTAGHINPGLSIANELRRRFPDSEIWFVGKDNGMERTLVPKEGYNILPIDLGGFSREKTFSEIKYNIYNVKRSIRAYKKCRRFLKEFKPDIVIGTGGYASGPAVLAASKLHIPTVIHEQNAIAGVTTKLLAKKADRIFTSFADTKGLEGFTNTVLTGNPVRQSLLDADRESSRKELNLDGRPLILSYGGSLGADIINRTMIEVLEASEKEGKYQHIHATGVDSYDETVAELEKRGIRYHGETGIYVEKYIYNMDKCMAASDLLISRAGAITLAEITCLGKPSILIPSPNVAENHQYFNALRLKEKDAAFLIEEKNLSAEGIIELIEKALDDKDRLNSLSENAKSMGFKDASVKIADEIIELLEKKKLG